MSLEVAVLRDKGVLTLPAGLRRKYNLMSGEIFSILDLGEGTFVLTRRSSHLDELGDRVAQLVRDAGYTVEELLATLDEERESYYAEHYESKD
jgi:bifunctional DNA-binding transcriptional regulator/antitoxin component of YhaV-PrlF toxin-antitoxin module